MGAAVVRRTARGPSRASRGVAQLAEQRSPKPQAAGSIPVTPATPTDRPLDRAVTTTRRARRSERREAGTRGQFGCPGPDGASDAELTDEQIDAEAPGVDDAGELEAAEAELAAEAEADEDKVVAPPARRRRGRITADDDEDDDDAAGAARRTAAGPRADRPDDDRHPFASGRGAGPGRGPGSVAVRRFLREVVAELRKVIWPGRKELITYTAVVIVFVAFMVALVAGLDLSSPRPCSPSSADPRPRQRTMTRKRFCDRPPRALRDRQPGRRRRRRSPPTSTTPARRRGTADLETGAGETARPRAPSTPVDTADEVADVVPPWRPATPTSTPPTAGAPTPSAEEDEDPAEELREGAAASPPATGTSCTPTPATRTR